MIAIEEKELKTLLKEHKVIELLNEKVEDLILFRKSDKEFTKEEKELMKEVLMCFID